MCKAVSRISDFFEEIQFFFEYPVTVAQMIKLSYLKLKYIICFISIQLISSEFVIVYFDKFVDPDDVKI